MYLENVTVKGFRLFENLNLTLNPGLNVLVGANDSGKTSIIDAIRYVLGSNSSDREFIAESDFFANSDTFSIQLKFSDVDAHAHRFVEHLSYERFRAEDHSTSSKLVLYVQLNAKKTGKERRGYPEIQKSIQSGYDGIGRRLETEILSFLAVTYLKPLRDAEAELSPGRSSRLSQILNSSKDILNSTDEILNIVADANALLLDPNGALKNSADEICRSYLHKLIFESDKADLGAYVDIAGVHKDTKGRLPDAAAKRRHLRSVLEGLSLALTQDGKKHGLGYHNLLFMAAELLLLEQAPGNEFALLLVEEPEAHLHPQLQMKLLQFINQKVRPDKDSNGIQCILTTVSPNLSSKADPSTVILMGDGKPWSLRYGETELAAADYVFLQKFLDATKANVFYAKGLLFVEGNAENILLPTLAKLLGLPLENFGVSVIRYDNSGSWKRFVKLFLRNGKDGEPEAWAATRVCVLRDLDLWPTCAERMEDESNPYGFIAKLKPNAKGQGGNLDYWEDSDKTKRTLQIEARKSKFKKDKKEDKQSLERQNVKVVISDRWTFEFCLALYGLFSECCLVLGVDEIEGTDDEKATYIQSLVSKTDFAYNLGALLEKNRREAVESALGKLDEGERCEPSVRERITNEVNSEYAGELRAKLPPYICEAIDHVTAITDNETRNTTGGGK